MKSGGYQRLKSQLETHVKTYEDPQLDVNGNVIEKVSYKPSDLEERKGGLDDDEFETEAQLKAERPLERGVLTVNLGIPIVIALNKADCLENATGIKK